MKLNLIKFLFLLSFPVISWSQLSFYECVVNPKKCQKIDVPSNDKLPNISEQSASEIQELRAEREKLAAEALAERTRRLELEERLKLPELKPVTNSLLSERRVALVVGNANYKNSPLANPVNDAVDMSETLKSLGFQVTTVQDANLFDDNYLGRLTTTMLAG
jgi:hypothetical protein